MLSHDRRYRNPQQRYKIFLQQVHPDTHLFRI
jgi:hypothetical protein